MLNPKRALFQNVNIIDAITPTLSRFEVVSINIDSF